MTAATIVPLIGNDRVRTLAEAAQRVIDGQSWRRFRDTLSAAHAWAKMQENFYALRRELLHAEIEALRNIAELSDKKGIPKDARDAADYYASLTPQEIEKLVSENVLGVTRAVGLAKRQMAVVRQRERGATLAEGSWNDQYTARNDAEGGLADAIRQAVDLAAKSGYPVTIGEIARGAMHRAEMDVSDAALYEGALYVCRKAIRETSVEWTRGTNLPRLLTVRLADGDMIRVPIETATVRNLRNMLAYREEQLVGYVTAVETLRALAESISDVEDDAQLSEAILSKRRRGNSVELQSAS